MFSKKANLVMILASTLVFLFACTTQPDNKVTPEPTPETEIIQKETPAALKPFPVTVELGDRVVTIGDIQFAPQLIVLGGDFTTIIYSISGLNNAQSAESLSPIMSNEKGQEIKTNQIRSLADLNGVQFGAFTFEQIPPGTKSIELALRGISGDARLNVMSNQGDSEYWPGGTFYPGDYLEQDGYRISINGLALSKGDRIAKAQSRTGQTDEDLDNERATRAAGTAAKATPSEKLPTLPPPSPDPTAVELAGGKPILQLATVRIENLESGLVQYLYIAVLEDGEVRSAVAE